VRILVANDDGIYSPGIRTLAEIAAEFGDVRVVAPDVEQSSMGHAITASRPLSYRPTRLKNGIEAYRVNGTPADCVALGAYHWEKVDVVLSGVNIGLNLGNSIWHSGTLAAAKQAALLGVRGIALSAPATNEPDYENLKPWIRRVLEVVLTHARQPLINVNFPKDPRGLLWTKVSVRHYDGRVVPTQDPMGRELYWFTVVPIRGSEEGTDRWAVERSWVSLTPLRLDLTDEPGLASARFQHPLDERVAAALRSEPPAPDAERTVREEEAKAEPVAGPAASS
jgi:5'-nucleotidase